MAYTAVNSVCAALSLTAFTFFIVASIAYTDRKNDVRNTAWFTSSLGSEDLYVGLTTIYGKSSDSILKFRSNDCTPSFCSQCRNDGRDAFALIIIAIFFSFAEFLTCFAYTIAVTVIAQMMQMLVALTSAAFSLVAVAMFMGSCYTNMKNTTGFTDFEWGPGSILATVGMLLMWVVVFLHVAGAIDVARPAVVNQTIANVNVNP